MGERTKIPWCDHTFNPVRGCARVSEECRFCYAADMAMRFPGVHGTWGKDGVRVETKSWGDPLRWNRKAEHTGARVFCGSMCDVFEDHPAWAEPRKRLFELISRTENLTWLLLTKRPENAVGVELPPNVWLGTSAGTQKTWDRNVLHLARCSATKKFVSMEPMLEPINMYLLGTFPKSLGIGYCDVWQHVDWVIVGAESGPNRRPFRREWARSIRDQCAQVNTPFFYKQEIDGAGKKIETPPLDGVVHVAFPDDDL